jgi:hypothetical protein
VITVSEMSRRAALAATPVAAAAGLALANAPTALAATTTTIKLYTTRTQNTLPENPTVGLPFIIDVDVFDLSGTKMGDGSVIGFVVAVTVGVPPKITIHSKCILRFATGELHLSSQFDRVVPSTTQNKLAIVGGTGSYNTARGEDVLVYTDLQRTDHTLTVITG